MTDIVLKDITSGYNYTRINDNFDKIEQVINNEVLHLVGGNNVMQQDVDMNSHALLNLKTNTGEPSSVLTVSAGDARYYNITGDTLQGVFNAGQYQVTNLPAPTEDSDAVRYEDLVAEAAYRQNADASLQEQLNGVNPPMGSAFSIISWHAQRIENSITIPDNVNAWSFGPVLTIETGQAVTIGANSYWTIANGAESGAVQYDSDYGVL